MKKTIKNRGVFAKLTIFLAVMVIFMVTVIGVVGCVKVPDSTDICRVKFDKKQAVFTLPKEATLTVKKQLQNFVTQEVMPKSQRTVGEFVVYVFQNGMEETGQTFRIERDGFVTKAGYFCQEGSFEFKFDSNVDIWQRKNYAQMPINGLAGIDDIMLTNVGGNYFKIMSVGEKFDLIALRNSMIVNDYISNIEIEPNFEAEILSGNSVKISQEKENIFCVSAVDDGVTSIKLKYQAIEVLNNGKISCYNASDINREVIITFAVGENFVCENNVKVNGQKFDSEFDTIYFDSEICQVDIEDNGADNLVFNGKTFDFVDGKCELNLNEGPNLVEIKKGNKSQFMTIFAKRINIAIQNFANKINVGDSVQIKVEGVFTALPKVSGIYNPTQNYTEGNTPTIGSRLQFVMANGDKLTAKYVSQYYNSANCSLEFIVKEEYLVDGKLVFDLTFVAEWWGSELGGHRKITQQGVPTNLNAQLYQREVGIFVKA